MTKSDDSSLDPQDLRAVEKHARKLLDRAAAWDRFPTPIEDILDAAKLKVAPESIFDPAHIVEYMKEKGANTKAIIKSAVSKILGAYDGFENLIHVDGTLVESKQNFIKLHETGHHEIPTHRKLFGFFQDCEKTLKPEIADLFERQANNFARFALFQGDRFALCAADCELNIKVPMKLAKKFGASIYASAREFARTNHRACVVYVLEPIEFVHGDGARAAVRRIEPSPSFEEQFGKPDYKVITLDHKLGKLLPINRKMSSPTAVTMTDKNGDEHECIAEAFKTKYNVFILLYPQRALTSSSIIVPHNVKIAGA